MLKDQFFTAAQSIFEEIRQTESDRISEAAELIAEAVSHSKTVILYDRGHLLGGELLSRAGGPLFMRRLDYVLPDPALRSAQSGIREKRLANFKGEAREAAVHTFEDAWTDYLMQVNDLGAGDVLIINSVSGKGHSATSIARAAKKAGVTCIILSSATAAEVIAPEGGGKRLIDYADLFIDNHVPFGDALFELEGVEEKVFPASGLSAAAIGWAMVIEAIEKTIEKGVSPSVFRSNNIPGGPEQNKAVFDRYAELGY